MAERKAINDDETLPGWRVEAPGEDVQLLEKTNVKIRIEKSADGDANGLLVSKHEDDDWRYPTPSPGDVLHAIGGTRKQPPLTPPAAGMEKNGDVEHAKQFYSEEGELLRKKVDAFEVDDRLATPPPDRYNMVYFIILCHGIAVLLSWNMIITAQEYFTSYKFNREDPDVGYRKDFLYYVSIASQVPQFIFCVLNVVLNFGGGLTRRIVASLSIMVAVYATLIILAIVDTQSWPFEFFVITIVLVVILNMCNGVYQNSIFGVAGMLPGKYSNAVVLGNNISGTLCALIGIIAKAATSSSGTPVDSELRKQGIYYFVAVLIVLLIAFQSYFILPFLKYFTFFQHAQNREIAAAAAANMPAAQRRQQPLIQLVSFSELYFVFKQIKIQCFNIFFVFFVTLSLFPVVQAEVKSQHGFLGSYFTIVTCFLSFNFFAMVGNLLPAIATWPGPRAVIVPIVLRVLFYPFFMLSNATFASYDPKKPCDSFRDPSIPVVIYSDAVYIIGSILFALTSGYFSSLIMMYAPRLVEAKHAPRAGQIAAFFLVLGVTSGVIFAIVVKAIMTEDECPTANIPTDLFATTTMLP